MKREIKSIIPTRNIVVMEAAINDDVIAIIQAHDDFDEQLNFVVRAYIAHIEDNTGIEILRIGNCYFVTEDAIYIAQYEDDINQEYDL
jgi:hypothetical protein